ncbi:MAG TPA: glycosyltransferase family 4 protein [Alphaproteobacteria bacterium]|nr:glycosyltransferase family 4 protein [Alphaproteobacteria bacterium]
MTDTKDRQTRFLMILNHIDWFWSHRLPLADAILKRDWELHLATHSADEDPKLKKMGVIGHGLPKMGRSINPISQLIQIRAMIKLVKETQPDIIHAITLRTAFYVGLATRLIGYKPVTFTVAGLGSLYTAPGLKMKMLRLLALPLIKFAFGGKGKFIIFQNPDDRNAMLQAGIVKEDRTTIIRGSGVDLKEFPYTPYEETDEEPIILFTSRLMREKGITDFIAAARILKEEGIKARFQVAGNVYPDNARSISKAEMDAAHAEGAIEWLGQCSDMPDLLTRCMMVVLPSYYGEGVPKVLLETASIGRPIITCDAPGCREAVEHEVNGELVLPQCPTDLALAIKKLIEDPERRHCYGAAGRRRMEEDFHVDSVVSRTMDVYDQLLAEDRAEKEEI